MSLGYGGFARLVLKDEKSALYVYKCENLNRLDNDPKEDGQIYIELEPIASAHVPKKTKRYPEGIPLLFVENVDFGKMLADGSLGVENCTNCSLAGDDGVDVQAWDLIFKIALEIQRNGTFPETVGYFK
ncbi:MAG TPA: hypothetical protein IAC12_07140 [Candidatus Aphodovivens avistercoris]|nr:hypothetical protein [Candidatus Aphodovivens avistercoris]